jgi:hypothetical protein
MMSLGVLLRTPASNSLMKTVAVPVYVFASAQEKNHENESARPWLKGCYVQVDDPFAAQLIDQPASSRWRVVQTVHDA